MPNICILTPAPGYYEDWSVPKGHYERLLGAGLTFRSWVEPGDLSGFGMVLPLIAWGYQRDCPRWFALLDRLEADTIKIANPAKVLRWNSDKAYLLELGAIGVPVVPTQLTDALSENDLAEARSTFSCEKLVVKPPISGGADGTHVLVVGEAIPLDVAGLRTLIQPYLPAIAEEGEYSLFFFGGEYSHAILKRPANGDFRVQEQFGGREEMITADDAMKALAEKALAGADTVTDCGTLAYARIDMIRDEAGVLRLMELELIEPSLFLHHATDDGAAFAKAILSLA